jgi:hypothetical protein
LKALEQNKHHQRLPFFAVQKDIKIQPTHVLEEQNGLADALSRD